MNPAFPCPARLGIALDKEDPKAKRKCSNMRTRQESFASQMLITPTATKHNVEWVRAPKYLPWGLSQTFKKSRAALKATNSKKDNKAPKASDPMEVQ
jgi:hypothetical protein